MALCRSALCGIRGYVIQQNVAFGIVSHLDLCVVRDCVVRHNVVRVYVVRRNVVRPTVGVGVSYILV